jgi:Fic family protein
MLDDNWETINGPAAHNIEVLNATNQINALEGLITFLLAHRGPDGKGKPPMPDEAALCELHHSGTLFLLAKPGTYRNMEVHVRDKDGNITYQAPPWQAVPGLMQHFFRDLSSVWTSGDALDAASYSLWRINWVHPFRNGNGRTARAFAYACLSIKLDAVLPGRITVIDQITADRDRYNAVLKEADLSFERTLIPDLKPMKEFLHELLQKQIDS